MTFVYRQHANSNRHEHLPTVHLQCPAPVCSLRQLPCRASEGLSHLADGPPGHRVQVARRLQHLPQRVLQQRALPYPSQLQGSMHHRFFVQMQLCRPSRTSSVDSGANDIRGLYQETMANSLQRSCCISPGLCRGHSTPPASCAAPSSPASAPLWARAPAHASAVFRAPQLPTASAVVWSLRT